MRTLSPGTVFSTGLPYLFATLVCFLAVPALSEHASSPLSNLDDADQAALEALALYEPEVRSFALEAVTEADVLSDLIDQQRRSRDTFTLLVEPYDQSTQEQLYELTRYPAIVREMAAGGAKSAAELEAIAAGHPSDELRNAVRTIGLEQPKLVARADALLRDQESQFQKRIGALSAAKRTAFHELLGRPELMALLTENVSLAVLLGGAYERTPAEVVAQLDALNHELSERAASEARDFAAGVDVDPELKREVESVTQEYERETGYSAYQPTVVVEQTVIVRPYSWWVGYPTWYPERYGHYSSWYYWYPRAHWSVGGFYYGPRYSQSIWLPAPPFWGWYFARPIHHQHFPHVTHHVVEHTNRFSRHRRPHRFHRAHAVHRFERHLERTMPYGFLHNDRKRVQRFREYGSLRSDWDRKHRGRSRHERGSAGDSEMRGDFQNVVETDAKQYPNLNNLGRRAGWNSERIAPTRVTDPRHRDTQRSDEGRARPSYDYDTDYYGEPRTKNKQRQRDDRAEQPSPTERRRAPTPELRPPNRPAPPTPELRRNDRPDPPNRGRREVPDDIIRRSKQKPERASPDGRNRRAPVPDVGRNHAPNRVERPPVPERKAKPRRRSEPDDGGAEEAEDPERPGSKGDRGGRGGGRSKTSQGKGGKGK